MKSSIHSFSLGGQGCSASGIGADLCYNMLQNKKYKYALLVSTENITQNFYMGQNKSMLLPNILFRMGCAAILLTNEKKGSKYELTHIVRTHIGADDEAHRCIYQQTDAEGKIGVHLAKTVTSNAQKALTINMNTLFRQILPLSLKADYAIRLGL